MSHRSTRRAFIATLGTAGTVSISGCSSIFGDSKTPSNKTGTPSPTTGTSPTKTTAGGGTPTKTQTKKKTPSNEPFKRGTVVDDFEGNVGKRWQIDYGKYATTTKDAYQGKQSIVLVPREPSKRQQNRPIARISKYFGGGNSKPLDLSNQDLTMAVKVEKPESLKITATLAAPTKSISLQSTRYIPLEMDGWVRYDLGYTGAQGVPDLKNVLQMEIVVAPNSKKDFRVTIDDIRTIPKPKKGKVMFHFDDGRVSAYTKAFPIFKQKGWPAAVAAIPGAISSDGHLTRAMMVEMSKQGWDMMSHPATSMALPKLPKNVQERKIQQAYRSLSALGFEKGARHFVAPYSRVDNTTLDILSKYHKTGFLFGGCPNNALQPSNPYFLSRVQGGSVRGTKQLVDMAERFSQLVVISYHIIGTSPKPNTVTMGAFKDVVDYVATKDVDVITPSQLIDGK